MKKKKKKTAEYAIIATFPKAKEVFNFYIILSVYLLLITLKIIWIKKFPSLMVMGRFVTMRESYSGAAILSQKFKFQN